MTSTKYLLFILPLVAGCHDEKRTKDSVGDSADSPTFVDLSESVLSSGNSLTPVGDFDGDGLADIVSTYADHEDVEDSTTLYWTAWAWYGSVDASGYGAPFYQTSIGSSEDSLLFGHGDFDGDGSSDVAFSEDDGWPEPCNLFIMNGGWRRKYVSEPDSQILTEEEWITELAGAGDVNADGIDDLVWANALVDRVVMLHGPLVGKMVAVDSQLVLSTPDKVGGISLTEGGDINGDGYADLLIGGEDEVYVQHGPVLGDMNLSEADVIFDVIGQPASIDAADANGDGYGDVLLGQWLFEGPFDEGTLTSVDHAYQVEYALSENPVAAETDADSAFAGDVDGDGWQDVVITYHDPVVQKTYLFTGPLSGMASTFDANVYFLDNSGGYGVRSAGDINGDGLDDVLLGYNLYLGSADW